MPHAPRRRIVAGLATGAIGTVLRRPKAAMPDNANGVTPALTFGRLLGKSLLRCDANVDHDIARQIIARVSD